MPNDPKAKILLNEAELEGIEQNLITYLNGIPEFVNLNFKAGSLAVFIRVAKFVIRNLAFQLNKTVAEVFLDTATMEKSIYSLIQNFNFIPEMRRPAKRFLDVDYNLPSGYTPEAGSKFKIVFNTVRYTDTLKAVPTLRDKWQASQYVDDILNVDFMYGNMFYRYMDLEISGLFSGSFLGGPSTPPQRKLKMTTPLYQASWRVNEVIVDPATFPQRVFLVDDEDEFLMDKVVKDSIRVFVKETDDNWYEYFNVREGNFDSETLRAFNLVFDVETGLSVQFGIDHLCRSILDTETVRVFYAFTEGHEANDEQGKNELTAEDIHDYQIIEVKTDGSEVLISEYLSTGSVPPIELNTGGFSARIINADGDLALLDNGVDRQSLESITVSAPLFRTTQGRAVTETDYNVLLRNKFSEYGNIRAWGGHREVFNIEQMIQDALVTHGGDALEAVKLVLSELYTGGTPTIIPVSHEALNSGNFRRDLGFVYYTFFDEGFNFVHSGENRQEIVQYLDRFKIMTMYHKFMNPVFKLLKPRIKLTLNPSYASDFSYLDVRKAVKEWINGKTAINNVIDIQDMNSKLFNREEVKVVDSITYTAKVKMEAVGGLNVVRTFNRFLGDQSAKLMRWVGGEYVELATVGTQGNVFLVNGSPAGQVNPNMGAFTVEHPLFVAGEVFYIDGLKYAGHKVNSLRECFVGIERIEDVELIVE